MKRRSLLLAPVLAVVLGAAPALADTAKTVTATGTGQTRVHPANRNSNASIAAAVEAAKRASIRGAIKQAHEYATMYAKQSGLTLGTVISISDVQSNTFYGPGAFFGPFGPNQFCGTVRQPIFKKVKGKRKIVGSKKVHRCFAPQFAFTSVSVTYDAS